LGGGSFTGTVVGFGFGGAGVREGEGFGDGDFDGGDDRDGAGLEFDLSGFGVAETPALHAARPRTTRAADTAATSVLRNKRTPGGWRVEGT